MSDKDSNRLSPEEKEGLRALLFFVSILVGPAAIAFLLAFVGVLFGLDSYSCYQTATYASILIPLLFFLS